jgi:hypothetical protein
MNRHLRQKLCRGIVCLAAVAAAAPARAAPRAEIAPRHLPVLQAHCGKCHGAETQESGVRVDDLPATIDTVAAAERWQKVLNVLNSGEMPPDDEPRIDPAAKTEFLDALSEAMVVARRTLADQGGVIAMRRLNRREYKNTLRDLLGVEVAVHDLPADTSPLAFDTVGAGLFMTAAQFEQYEAIARDGLALAFARQAGATQRKSLHIEAETTLPNFVRSRLDVRDLQRRAAEWFRVLDEVKARPENAAVREKLLADVGGDEKKLLYVWYEFAGMPPPETFGFPAGAAFNPAYIAAVLGETRWHPFDDRYLALPGLDSGGWLTVKRPGFTPNPNDKFQFVIPLDWPPGEYRATVRCAAADSAAADRRFLEFNVFPGTGGSPPLSVHQVAGTLADPCEITIPFTVGGKGTGPGDSRLYVFREKGMGDERAARVRITTAEKEAGIGPEPAIWIDWIHVERLPDSPAAVPPGIRALDGVPLVATNEPVAPDDLRRGFERFCIEAWRGVAPPAGAVDRLVRIYDGRRAVGGGHVEALGEALAAALSAPQFLYKAEPDDGATRRPLDGPELATRLSYFLWGGPPDGELRRLAASGALLEPAVLRAQTDRLLDDERSRGFVEPFLFQWLAMDRLDFFQFDPALYPRFDQATKQAARREVFETFAHLLAGRGRLSDLLTADFVVVNGLLAGYYGLDGVSGDEFRRVALPAGSPRGGLIGMAAIHAMGSNGEHTSPVERGAWVLRKLLNDPPPPAPPNVPQLARLAGKPLTTRERVSLHQEEPQCANCHRKIDPIGFGLENFDAVGAWRTTDTYVPMDENGKPLPKLRTTWTIDAAGALHGGPAFADFFGLRGIIASRPMQFARGFTAALVEYALGRPCGFSDEPLLDEIVAAASSEDLAVRSFIHALVQSRTFQTK